MKIAFIRAHLHVGGVEVNQMELARLFAANGFDVDVWLWDAGTAPWMAERYTEGGVHLRMGLPEDPNVYDAIVAMVPSLYYDLLERYTGRLYCIIGNRAPAYYSKGVEERLDVRGCICDSQDTVNYIHDITPGLNCFKWFYMKEPEILDVPSARATFKLPEDEIIFGTMCNLGPKKQVNRMITAFGEAIKLGMKNAHLAIAGDGREFHKLQAQAMAELPAGSYTFAGRQHTYSTGPFLSSLDCFLTTHDAFQGGICMCANESVGAGCYLIIGDVAGIPENILSPEFGTILDNNELDAKLPHEMLKFSVEGRQILDTIKDRIKGAYRDMYDSQKGIIEWIKK